MEPDSWLLSNFVPLPGSHVYHNPELYGITWMSKDWDDYYLVGKGNNFNYCFEANGLNRDDQALNHSMMKTKLKQILGEQ